MDFAWQTTLSLFFGLLVLFFATGLPVAFGFLIINIVTVYLFLGGTNGLSLLATSAFSSVAQFSLIPIPLFILMGELLLRTRLASMTIDVVDLWVGRLPGRLAISAVGAGTMFGALSGASMASVAMLGSTLVPEMTRRAYRPEMSVASILAGGGLAVLIPPSALGVLLGAMAKISIAALLIAGILPGLVLASLYLAYFAIRAKLQPALAPPYRAPPASLRERLGGLLTIAPLLSLVVVVTGFILLGIATPSESAAMGVTGTLLLALAYRRLTRRALFEALISTVRTTSMILLIIVGSSAFSQVLAATGATAVLVQWVTGVEAATLITVILMQVLVLVLGCFIDTISIMMVTIPVFMPVVHALGLDPIWFSILILIQLELAGITPPFGVLLFVLKGVQPQLSMTQIYRAAFPIILIQLLLVAVVMAFPSLTSVLPALMEGQ